jgi:hypothetical protein
VEVAVPSQNVMAKPRDKNYPPMPLDTFLGYETGIAQQALPEVLGNPESAYNLANNHDALETGDVILFQGVGVKGLLIRWATWCDYSHVGVVHRWHYDDGTSDLFVWESTGHVDGIKCLLHDEPKSGPRLIFLRDRLLRYIEENSSGDDDIKVCVIRSYVMPPLNRIEMDLRMRVFETHLRDSSYCNNALHFIRNAMWSVTGGRQLDQADGKTEYTCAVLVAATLRHLEILDSGLEATSLQRPADFLNDTELRRVGNTPGFLSMENHHFTLVHRGPVKPRS